MNSLLYITDQEEYSENGTISTLFNIYLREYWNVDIVYVTKYKTSFAKKENNLIVPSSKQNNIIPYLINKDINIDSYDFIFIRNKRSILKNVLKYKKTYNYKIAFRVSYPIKHHKLEFINTFFPYSLIKEYQYKQKIKNRDFLVNQCDLFLPSSSQAKDQFYSNIKIESFPIFTGLDPEKLNKHIVSFSDTIKFIYIGSIDKIREFHVILDAFLKISDKAWHLNISTTSKVYITSLLNNYPQLKPKISLLSAMSLKELREQINQNDVGIALLPRNKFYDTVLADKVIDYYSCSLPALLTSNEKNHSIFDEDEAYFCDFDVDSIAEKLKFLINTPSQSDAIVGNKGQQKLLSLKRNYKTLAQDLAKKLDEIVKKS